MTTLTKEEIPDNRWPFLCSFRISNKDEKLDLTSFYCIPKLHKCPCKQLYCWVCQMPHKTSFQIINIDSISGQKQPSELYCESVTLYIYIAASYSRGGVNQMWILKNSKDPIKVPALLMQYY